MTVARILKSVSEFFSDKVLSGMLYMLADIFIFLLINMVQR